MKKSLKIWLITWVSVLVAWWARAWLTKAWIIPNWFDIEFLNLYLSDEYGKCVDCNWKIVEWYKIKMFVEDNNWNRCCEWTYSLKFIDDKHQYYWCVLNQFFVFLLCSLTNVPEVLTPIKTIS